MHRRRLQEAQVEVRETGETAEERPVRGHVSTLTLAVVVVAIGCAFWIWADRSDTQPPLWRSVAGGNPASDGYGRDDARAVTGGARHYEPPSSGNGVSAEIQTPIETVVPTIEVWRKSNLEAISRPLGDPIFSKGIVEALGIAPRDENSLNVYLDGVVAEMRQQAVRDIVELEVEPSYPDRSMFFVPPHPLSDELKEGAHRQVAQILGERRAELLMDSLARQSIADSDLRGFGIVGLRLMFVGERVDAMGTHYNWREDYLSHEGGFLTSREFHSDGFPEKFKYIFSPEE
jgi:hypothetical protein